MRRISILAALMLISTCVSAGSGTGIVTGLIPYSDGATEIVIVKTSEISGSPLCNNTARFAMNSANPRFKNTVSVLLAAYAAAKPIRINGSNTCNVWSNAEDINYVCIGDISC